MVFELAEPGIYVSYATSLSSAPTLAKDPGSPCHRVVCGTPARGRPFSGPATHFPFFLVYGQSLLH